MNRKGREDTGKVNERRKGTEKDVELIVNRIPRHWGNSQILCFQHQHPHPYPHLRPRQPHGYQRQSSFLRLKTHDLLLFISHMFLTISTSHAISFSSLRNFSFSTFNVHCIFIVSPLCTILQLSYFRGRENDRFSTSYSYFLFLFLQLQLQHIFTMIKKSWKCSPVASPPPTMLDMKFSVISSSYSVKCRI